MRRSTTGHCFSFGFGLAVAVTSFAVWNGDQPWVVAYAGLFTALVSETTCWLWRVVNLPSRKRRADLRFAQVDATQSERGRSHRLSTQRGSQTLALPTTFVSDASAAVPRY
jgi:hypothetical protein